MQTGNEQGPGHDPWTENPILDETPVKKKGNKEGWERDLIAELAMGALKEQRRARRWGIFFKLLFVAYLVVFLVIMIPSRDGGGLSAAKDHTALIELRGVIAADAEASADNVVTSLRKAFESSHAKAIILRINSPGGSPVQAGYVYDEIQRLRTLHPGKPVYAVIADMCASGGYYIAAAADEIYADKASMVGSIGVIMSGFGFVDSMEKLGVERRLMSAGENKGFLDPFSPLRDEDVEHIEAMLGNIHQQFIEVVRRGRGERLAADERLFSGLVWTGEQSLELGLVDGLGSASYVARELVGHERIVDYTVKPDPFQRFASQLGVVMAETLARLTGMESNTLR